MIEGKRFQLRHVFKHDLERLTPLLNNLALRGDHLPYSMTAPQLIEHNFERDSVTPDALERLLIVDKQDDILGSLWHFKGAPYFNAREIGYILYKSDLRRSGIVSEAVAMLCDYLFKSRLLNRLEIRMNVDNIASEKVAVKCGFQKEGIARQASFSHGRHVDVNVYALLRREWEQLRV
jgi:ribosomal-protein-alanine N-acetyltransferase